MWRLLGGRQTLRASICVACVLGVAVGPAAASAVAAGAEILYVAPGGGDPSCVSPCASVQQAVERAGQDLGSGAASSVLIEVAAGFYSGNVTIPALPGTEPVTDPGHGRVD